MKVIQINDEINVNQDITARFTSISDLENEVGVRLLQSPYAENNLSSRIQYRKIGPGYNEIKISAYITGDTDNITYYNDTKNSYSWTSGILYHKPVDLEIIFISDSSQGDVGREYLGSYDFYERYTSDQGYLVNILSFDGSSDEYRAIFVADGIFYQLNARTSLEELKKIINSFHY